MNQQHPLAVICVTTIVLLAYYIIITDHWSLPSICAAVYYFPKKHVYNRHQNVTHNVIGNSTQTIMPPSYTKYGIKFRYWNSSTPRHDSTVDLTKSKHLMSDGCWESPYIDCGNGFHRNYSSSSDVFQKNTVSNLAPGQTVFRVNETTKRFYDNNMLAGNKTFRVAWMYRPKWVGLKDFNFQGCDFHNCKLSREVDEDVDLVVVYAVNIPTKVAPPRHRSPLQLYGMFGIESPVHFGQILNNPSTWTTAFNITLHYSLDSDIWAPYSKLEYHAPTDRGHNITDIVRKKTKTAIWLVSNCGAPSGRNQYVKELQKYIDVDIFGRCGQPCTNVCEGPMDEYRFYLAFENSLCPDYITEKLFKLFNTRNTVVPVVRGGANYDKYFDPGTFINAAHFKSPKELALYLKKISGDFDAYEAILQQKMRYVNTPEKFRWKSFHCNMCEFLNHRNQEVRSYYDILKWTDSRRCWAATEILH